MFESILEKILVNNLGQFIEGLDRDNLKLSIWSGNIVIENISIKPEVLNMLELPVKMKFSYLGRLKLSVPWKSLGSKPVEVLLENIYVVLEPVARESWVPTDYKNIHKRLELLEMFIADYMKKILAGRKAFEQGDKKEKEEDQGMIARMTEKVIDNFQVSIPFD
jgi:vacuolar protein sorting-associated protein 13A/C